MKSLSTLSYPAKFTKEPEGGYSVSFVNFSEGHTQGDTWEEAFRMAIDCLHACIEYRLEEKAEIPEPSEKKARQVAVPVALQVAPKLALYKVMRKRKLSNSQLARDMHVSEGSIRRMLNPRHKSKPEQYTRALLALGYAVEGTIE